MDCREPFPRLKGQHRGIEFGCIRLEQIRQIRGMQHNADLAQPIINSESPC